MAPLDAARHDTCHAIVLARMTRVAVVRNRVVRDRIDRIASSRRHVPP
jgi:hypothetical protein